MNAAQQPAAARAPRKLMMRSALLGIAVLLGAAATVALVKAARVVWSVRASLHPRRGPVSRRELPKSLASATEMNVAAANGAIVSGWYVPPRNGAAVVFVHGTSADRRQLRPEAAALVEKGFGALLFDLPGHGESTGSVRWGAGERDAVAATVDFLAGKPEVRHVGAFGFSLGGWPLLAAAVADPRIEAVVLEGTLSDPDEQTLYEYRGGGPIAQRLAIWCTPLVGFRLLPRRPLDLVGALRRPLLVIGGEADPVVPASMVRQLYEAAERPKDLWIVPGAGHGGYADLAGPLYQARLVSFFESALLPNR